MTQMPILEYRKVLSVTPTVVIYTTPRCPTRSTAVWGTEWVDWAVDAARISHNGQLLPQEELDRVAPLFDPNMFSFTTD